MSCVTRRKTLRLSYHMIKNEERVIIGDDLPDESSDKVSLLG